METNNSRYEYLRNKYSGIGKLNTKISRLSKLRKQKNSQYYDILSELEVINSLERLLNKLISDICFRLGCHTAQKNYIVNSIIK